MIWAHDERQKYMEICRSVSSRIELRGLLTFASLQLEVSYEPVIIVNLRWYIPNADDREGGRIGVESSTAISVYSICRDPEIILIDLIRQALWEALRHELNEGFWVDGTFYTHPHPENER